MNPLPNISAEPLRPPRPPRRRASAICGGVRRLALAAIATTLLPLLAFAPRATAQVAGAPGAAPADPTAELVAAALAANPGLEALRARIDAIQQDVTRAGAWANPNLSLALQNLPDDSFRLGEEPMSMLALRLSQTFPLAGKTGKRREVQQAAGRAAESALAEARNQLRAEVRQNYYRLALARRLRDLTDAHLEEVEELIVAVTARYASGGASQQDILRLQVEADRLRDRHHDFSRRESTLQAALNAALHRAADTPIPTSSELQLPVPPGMDLDQLVAIAERERPALRRLRHTAEQQQAKAALARAETFADPTVFLQYGLRRELDSGAAGRDLISVGVSWPLPLFRASRNQAPAAAAEARAGAAAADGRALRDRIESELQAQLDAWNRAAEKSRTYRATLIPGTRQVLETALGDYRVGRTDFNSLFQAEVQLLDFEETLFRATVTALIARAEIERLIGTELS